MFKLFRLFVLSIALLLLGLAPVVLASDSNTVEMGAQVRAGNDTALIGTLAQTDTVTGTEESTGTIGTDTTDTAEPATDTTETGADTTEATTDTTEADVTTTETATDAVTGTTTTAEPTPATTQQTMLPATGGVVSSWPSLLLLVAGAVFVLIGILSLAFARRSR